MGALVVQLAAQRGIRVVGTARADDLDIVTSAGGVGVAYGDGWSERVRAAASSGIDAVLECAGAGLLPKAIELMGGPDRVLTIADMAAFGLGVRFSAGDPDDRSPGALPELVAATGEGRLTLGWPPEWPRSTPITRSTPHHHQRVQSHDRNPQTA